MDILIFHLFFIYKLQTLLTFGCSILVGIFINTAMWSHFGRFVHIFVTSAFLSSAYFLVKQLHTQAFGDLDRNEHDEDEDQLSLSCLDESKEDATMTDKDEFGHAGIAAHDVFHFDDRHNAEHVPSLDDANHEPEEHLSHVEADHEEHHVE